jgi:outer membrane protein assembly factor BamB
LVFVADVLGVVHCLDAETGRCYWTHETKGQMVGSTLVADGKVYAGNAGGKLTVLARLRGFEGCRPWKCLQIRAGFF